MFTSDLILSYLHIFVMCFCIIDFNMILLSACQPFQKIGMYVSLHVHATGLLHLKSSALLHRTSTITEIGNVFFHNGSWEQDTFGNQYSFVIE
jgi:hypothetical protein